MKIFISYKSEDLPEVEKIAEKLKGISPDVQISAMRKSKRWRSIAKKQIAKADYVLYVAGKIYNDNINWKIDTAIKAGHKVHCVKIDAEITLNKKLYVSGGFDLTSKTLKVVLHKDLDAFIDVLRGDAEYLQSKLFNIGNENTAVLIEQYKIMLSTSESLIERRQKLTTTYLSIFSVLLPVISAMLSLDYIFLYIGAAIISAICIILCLSWRSTIISYGNSNRAKFAILEELEKKLPTAIFASEWLALKRYTKKYKSFTERETAIPAVFKAVYALLFAVSIIMLFIRL